MPLTAAQRELVLSIPGSTDEDELALLHDLAAEVDEGACIVEVGSAKGRSTAALALGAMAGAGAPVYAIEPHERFDGVLGGRFTPANRALFFESMLRAGTAEAVRLVNLPSEAIAPGWSLPVGLVFIDGDHRYEGVRRDLEGWLPHVVPGGPVVLHDSTDPDLGPHRVVEEALAAGACERVSVVSRATVLRRRGGAAT